MPPARFQTFRNPDACNCCTAFALRPPHLAVHDDVARAVECRERLDDGAERDEASAGNTRDVPLVRLAHVDQIEVVAARDPLRELRGRDLGYRARAAASAAAACRTPQNSS